MTADPLYEVRVTGHVPDAVLLSLGDIVGGSEELRTVLSGHFPDQAALYGFLIRLRSLGLVVVEVRQVAESANFDPGYAGAEEEPGGRDRADPDIAP
jgi:hypothetical protein